MARWQSEWKTLYQTDREWLRVKKDGSEPTLEIADEIGEEDDESEFQASRVEVEKFKPKFQVFRVEVEKFKLVRDPEDPSKIYLVNSNYEPSWPHPLHMYEEWFAKHIKSVANSAGVGPLQLLKNMCSADPRVRAGGYMNFIGYFGGREFDDNPLELTESQLNKRWE